MYRKVRSVELDTYLFIVLFSIFLQQGHSGWSAVMPSFLDSLRSPPGAQVTLHSKRRTKLVTKTRCALVVTVGGSELNTQSSD